MSIKEKKYKRLGPVKEMALPLPLRFFYMLRGEKGRKEEKEIIKQNADEQITSTYKQFNYYCPHCLFQTNEFNKICPECRRGRLTKTKVEE